MQTVKIAHTDLTISRFVFGTSSLFSVGSSAKRRRLLDAACAQGFTHFDTAPYYGFGSAERDLKPVLASHPNVTVTTKVGIYSPGGEAQPDLGVLFRKAAGKIIPSLSRPTVDWSVARARGVLDGSLKRLGRSCIDLYMLHEPDRALVATDEWLSWMEREVWAGRVRRFGVALDARQVRPFLADHHPLADIVQTIDSLDGREADCLPEHGRPLQITYGYVSAARKQGRQVDVSGILKAALQRNLGGAIIVSTKRIERLGQYAQVAGS